MENKNVKIIVGTMQSGKSKMLIDIYKQKIEEGKTVEVFQPEENTRDGAFLTSRAYRDMSIPTSIYTKSLKSKADVVILDELNLVSIKKINKLKKDILKLKKLGKEIYIASLDLRADGKKFEQFEQIQDIVDETIEVYGTCKKCGAKSRLVRLIRDVKATDYIEGEDNIYIPVCEKHWKPIKIKDFSLQKI